MTPLPRPTVQGRGITVRRAKKQRSPALVGALLLFLFGGAGGGGYYYVDSNGGLSPTVERHPALGGALAMLPSSVLARFPADVQRAVRGTPPAADTTKTTLPLDTATVAVTTKIPTLIMTIGSMKRMQTPLIHIFARIQSGMGVQREMDVMIA